MSYAITFVLFFACTVIFVARGPDPFNFLESQGEFDCLNDEYKESNVYHIETEKLIS